MTGRGTLAAAAAVATIAAATAAMAAEGGAGFYLLGTRALMAGGVLPPGTCLQAQLFAYSGKAEGGTAPAQG